MGNDSRKRFLVPVADGIQAGEMVVAVSLLRRAGADVTVASVGPDIVVSSSGKVKVAADRLIHDCAGEDFHVILFPRPPPGPAGRALVDRLRQSESLRDVTERHTTHGRDLLTLCGPIADVAALSTPGAFPLTPWPEADTGRRGPGLAYELTLKLVGRLWGGEQAEAVGHGILVPITGGESKKRHELGPLPEPKNKASVLIPVVDGAEEMDAIVLVDVLRYAGAEVVLASVGPTPQIEGTTGVKLLADVRLEEVKEKKYDLIVLPGGTQGAQVLLAGSGDLDALLRGQAAAGAPLAATGASPVGVLQAKGLLDRKKATAHPEAARLLHDRGCVGERVVRDGVLVTSCAPGTALEFTLALVELLFGQGKADLLAEPLVYGRAPKRRPT